MKITLKILKPLDPPVFMSSSTHDFESDQPEIMRRATIALAKGWLAVMVPHWDESDTPDLKGKILNYLL